MKKKPIESAVSKAVQDAANSAAEPTAPVQAQDPRIPREAQLTVTGAELQVIYGALDELPGKFSRALYQKISAQVQAQIDAALKSPAT